MLSLFGLAFVLGLAVFVHPENIQVIGNRHMVHPSWETELAEASLPVAKLKAKYLSIFLIKDIRIVDANEGKELARIGKARPMSGNEHREIRGVLPFVNPKLSGFFNLQERREQVVGVPENLNVELGEARWSLPVVHDLNTDVTHPTLGLKIRLFDLDSAHGQIGAQLDSSSLLGVLRQRVSRVGIAAGDPQRLLRVGGGIDALPGRSGVGTLRYSVPAPSFTQSSERLPYRNYQTDYGSGAQERGDNRPGGCAPGFMRCFFSSERGAPLSAQISSVVILGSVTGLGILIGVGGVRRWRRNRRLRIGGFVSACGALLLFGWLLSGS